MTLISAAYHFAECYFGRETLESQHERLTGDFDDIGPQYESVHPFAPNYIAYTLGNMVHASRMTDDADTRPSTVNHGSRSGSKNGSLGSKGSRTRERKDFGSMKKSSGGSTDRGEKTSQERLAMSVISKIAAETEIRRRRREFQHQNATDTLNVIVDVARSNDTDSLDNRSEKPNNVQNKLKGSTDSINASTMGSYDFDKTEGQEDIPTVAFSANRTENRVQSHRFKATKVSNKGTFKTNDSMDDLSTSSS